MTKLKGDAMLLSTTCDVAGYDIVETLGVATGNVVRSKNVGADIIASLRSLVGGELSEYTSLMAGTRDQALDRLVSCASAMGADAVIGLNFTTSMVAGGSAELLAYGTAVKLRAKG